MKVVHKPNQIIIETKISRKKYFVIFEKIEIFSLNLSIKKIFLVDLRRNIELRFENPQEFLSFVPEVADKINAEYYWKFLDKLENLPSCEGIEGYAVSF